MTSVRPGAFAPPLPSLPSRPLRAQLDGVARGLAVAAFLIGLLVFLGWLLDVAALRSWLPRQVEAKPNTAVGIMLASVTLWLQSRGNVSARTRSLARLAAALVVLLAALTLGEYAFGWNAGVDQLVVREGLDAPYTVHAGRMPLPSTLCLLLMGMAGLAASGATRVRELVWFSLSTVVVALLAFLGELFDWPWLVAFGPFTPISMPTGVAFLLLGLGYLFAGAGGIEGWLRRQGRAAGLGAALALLLIMGGAVWRNTARLLKSADWVTHTHTVIERLAGTLSAMQDVETAARGYVLTGDTTFLEPRREAPATAHRLLDELEVLTRDNPAQQARLRLLRSLVEKKIRSTDDQIALRRAGEFGGAESGASLVAGRETMDAIRATVARLRTEEERLLQLRQDHLQASTARTGVTLVIGLVVAIGLLGGVFVLLRDEIRRRAASEQALRRSEESLAVTLDSIGDGVLATDIRSRVTLLNPVAEQLTGWSRAEAQGRPVAEVFRILHEETRAPVPNPVETVLATGAVIGMENHTALIARNGGERAIAESAAPIRDNDGALLGAVLVFRDVTETRRAQQELDRFFSLSLDFLTISSADGYFKRVSPGVEDMLGWTPEEFLATPYLELVHPDDLAATRREVERQITRGEKVLNFENRYRHKDGSYRVISWRSVPEPGTGLMYASARDVTKRNQVEEEIRLLNLELREHATRLESANQELEAFSYSVSHDLRAPLRHIQGYVEMLAREAGPSLSDKSQRFLKTIADASREMGQLIDDLLGFSRMGRAEMFESELDLGRLVDEARRGLELALRDRAVEWRVGALPPVRGDAAMLRQVLANLLGNAVKYTRGRQPAVIEVGCDGTDAAGRVVCYVRDNGAGFDMKYAGKLFGVFQRLHRADEFEGTGIGLANVRRIIARHGGRTWAEGRPGAGATFYFTLKPGGLAAAAPLA